MVTSNTATPDLTDLFVKRSSLPASVEIPTVTARILIDGKIQGEGFAIKSVFSPCSMRSEDGSRNTSGDGSGMDLEM